MEIKLLIKPCKLDFSKILSSINNENQRFLMLISIGELVRLYLKVMNIHNICQNKQLDKANLKLLKCFCWILFVPIDTKLSLVLTNNEENNKK